MKKCTRQGPKTMKTLSAPELAFIRGEGEGGTHTVWDLAFALTISCV